MRKEVVVALSDVQSRNLLGETEEIHEKRVRIFGLRSEI
jgi:hypothetical protein